MTNIRMAENLLYKDLSYKLVGLAYEVFNTLGSGLKEDVYGDAFEELLKKEKLKYKRELYYPIKINNKVISRNFFDFMIDGKIVIELKKGSQKYKEVCNQLYQYLRSADIKLGLVVRFTNDGVKIKRIPNLY